MDKKKVSIVTHSSSFHTDDIFAVATLLLVLGEENVSVVRSREKDVIEKADYVVDVGGILDPSNHRFDHHQEGGAGKRSNGVPYASFGLVWKEYGEKLCGSSEVAEKIDKILVQPIDAGDNGFDYMETKVPGLYPYDMGLFLNTFNPGIKDEGVNVDNLFMEAVPFAKIVLTREISKRKELAEVHDIVKKVYEEAPDKRLIVLDRFYPAREVLIQFPEPLFMAYKSINDGNWSLKAIPDGVSLHSIRKELPKAWAGKKDEELEKISGVPGAVFCHNNLFMCVNKTKEGILKMAEIALNS